MKLSDYDYHLPEELIAQTPIKNRSDSRLLVGKEDLQHRKFSNIVDYFQANDLLIFNNTKVIPARLHGTKETGGKVEILVERVLDETHFIAHIRANKSPKAGTKLIFDNDYIITVTGREDALFFCETSADTSVTAILESEGHMPLPPYIKREDVDEDKSRYQTVYAKVPGAVAAPTAGLHFTDEILEALKSKGVGFSEVTLHVGAGTFQPVKVDNIKNHTMHKEWVEVSEAVCEKVKQCKTNGGRVFAVGTTSVRSLESAAQSGTLQPYQGDTQLFITPGFKFNVVDVMLTNFHLPQSTLLMLVSAFSGYEEIKAAYQAAIEEEYRFFSYGDAMLLFKKS